MTSRPRSRGQRAGLTREAVVEAAVAVIRDSGPGGLSMRAVAARIGVAPNALYSHIADKDALVGAVLDGRLTRIPVPDIEGDPHAEVVGCMLTTFDVLIDEPALVPVYLARHGSSGPRATELGLALEVLIHRLGVPADRTRSVVRVLVLLTIGIAAQAVSEDGPITAPEFRRILRSSVGWVVNGAASGGS